MLRPLRRPRSGEPSGEANPANAIIPPITGWLGALFGRHNHFPLSIVFTLASGLCAMAGSLGRVIQGLAGGGLQQPSSQAVLQDPFPVENRAWRCRCLASLP